MTDRLPESSADKLLQQKIADSLALESAEEHGYAETIQYQYMLSLFRKSAGLSPELANKLLRNLATMLDSLLDVKATTVNNAKPGKHTRQDGNASYEPHGGSPFRCLQQEVQTRHARPEGQGVQLAFDVFFENAGNAESSADSTSNVELADRKQPLAELKSVQPLRQAWQKERRELLVRQAIANAPESAGPLNPDMLLVKSFSAMKDLSPAYMNQFIAYMETLLWLNETSQSL